MGALFPKLSIKNSPSPFCYSGPRPMLGKEIYPHEAEKRTKGPQCVRIRKLIKMVSNLHCNQLKKNKQDNHLSSFGDISKKSTHNDLKRLGMCLFLVRRIRLQLGLLRGRHSSMRVCRLTAEASPAIQPDKSELSKRRKKGCSSQFFALENTVIFHKDIIRSERNACIIVIFQ